MVNIDDKELAVDRTEKQAELTEQILKLVDGFTTSEALAVLESVKFYLMFKTKDMTENRTDEIMKKLLKLLKGELDNGKDERG